MKNLAPRSILFWGIPLSFVINSCVAGSILCFCELDIRALILFTLAIAGVGWLVLSVPVTIGMAMICHHIDGHDGLRKQFRAAIKCASLCFAGTALGLGCGYIALLNSVVSELLLALSFQIGVVGFTLMLLTVSNTFLRLYFIADNSELSETAFEVEH